ncbi:unnamed protein product [Urochloa humidicola]
MSPPPSRRPGPGARPRQRCATAPCGAGAINAPQYMLDDAVCMPAPTTRSMEPSRAPLFCFLCFQSSRPPCATDPSARHG